MKGVLNFQTPKLTFTVESQLWDSSTWGCRHRFLEPGCTYLWKPCWWAWRGTVQDQGLLQLGIPETSWGTEGENMLLKELCSKCLQLLVFFQPQDFFGENFPSLPLGVFVRPRVPTLWPGAMPPRPGFTRLPSTYVKPSKTSCGQRLGLGVCCFLFWKIPIMGWIFISCKKTHRLNTDQDGSRWFGLNSWMVWVDNSFFLCGLFTFGNTLRIAQPKLSQVLGGKSAWDDMSVMVRFLPRTRMRLTMSNVWCWRRAARRL